MFLLERKFALHSKRLVTLTCAALLACAASGLTAAASAATLNGAGSTLVAPILAEWATAFDNTTGDTVLYQSVGSGTGIKDITNRLVDFGASDAPLTSSQASACGGCYQIPWALSATGVGFHIGGLTKLHLTGQVIAQIYLGQINRWNDRRIAALNRGTHLPNLKITPVFRSDGSGDTYAFTDFESRVSSSFRNGIGNATTVSWPKGVGAKGNAGMATVLQKTNGAIAYVGVAYLIAHHLAAAALKNAAGNYEYPNLSNIENAAQTVRSVPSNNELHIVNPPASARIAFPISTFTYVIVPGNAPQGAELKKFILYAMGGGQAFAPSLDFAPLPSIVARAGRATLNKIH
jgi:phosphate transport system substrate-binding protein